MAAPEVGDEESSFEVATWRIVTLFLVIVAIDTAWEFFDEFVTHRLKTRMQIGLMHAWEQLKFETMALGLVSLLLVVCEVWPPTQSGHFPDVFVLAMFASWSCTPSLC